MYSLAPGKPVFDLRVTDNLGTCLGKTANEEISSRPHPIHANGYISLINSASVKGFRTALLNPS